MATATISEQVEESSFTSRTTIVMDDLPEIPSSIRRTWVSEMLKQCGETAGYRVVYHCAMAIYREVLLGCLRSQRMRRRFGALGDCDELLADFFARQLDSALEKWRTSGSGMEFRRWLVNALWFFLKTEEKKRRPTIAHGVEVANLPDVDLPSVSKTIDRMYAKKLVAVACSETKAILEKRGKGDSWRALYGQYYKNQRYSDLAEELGVSEDKVRTKMVPAAKRVFARILRQTLLLDTGSEDGLDDAIAGLRRALE